MSFPPPAVPAALANESTPEPFVVSTCPELPVLVGKVATLTPLATIETNPDPLLNIPVSKSSENVIEGTAVVPSGNVPPAFR